jgi:hypothetical protein
VPAVVSEKPWRALREHVDADARGRAQGQAMAQALNVAGYRCLANSTTTRLDLKKSHVHVHEASHE